MFVIIIVNLWATKGGDFYQAAAQTYMCKTESSANQTTTGKYNFDFFRCGIGCDIIILGDFTQNKIANTSANNIGFMPSLL